MIFKLYNCDFGLKINGVQYDFEHVEDLSLEDPEENDITRGGNAGNKVGIAYKKGVKDPKTFTVTLVGISAALSALLLDVYDQQTRIDGYCVDRTDGSSKYAKNAILSKRPQQMKVDDTAEAMNVQIMLKTFDLAETHKT